MPDTGMELQKNEIPRKTAKDLRRARKAAVRYMAVYSHGKRAQ